jgi:hypothetical protein
MPIQINQEFPHCARCGIMLHHSQGRFAAENTGGGRVVLCTDLCRTEYAELVGLAAQARWIEGAA